ncbi:MAG: rhodanese-like domain-containing protein [Candidatus Paceibacteria bacterium]
MTMIDEVTAGSAQLLDVRTAEEWQEAHAEHAIHIPISELLHGETGSLVPTKKVYIYCASGARANAATGLLQQRGFEAVCVGGLRDWLAAGGAEAK